MRWERPKRRSLVCDIVHDNFTKITSSQWGNSTEGGERRSGGGYKLSERTALKKSVSFPSRGLSSTFHYNLINTGSLQMHLETALNLCTGYDQHTLHNGEGREITELAGWGALRQEFNPSKGKFKAFV